MDRQVRQEFHKLFHVSANLTPTTKFMHMTLKEATLAKHQAAERLPFFAKLFQGKLTTDQYYNYLLQMHPVYCAIETAADNYGVLKEIADIKCAHRIQEDILELQEKVTTSFSFLSETKEYVDYINKLTDPKRIAAHVYVRHMGDLFGGQMIKTLVPGSGKWYWFNNQSDLKIKLRLLAIPDLAEEANTAFDFNINIIKQIA